jgi:hypothetical protein
MTITEDGWLPARAAAGARGPAPRATGRPAAALGHPGPSPEAAAPGVGASWPPDSTNATIPTTTIPTTLTTFRSPTD